MSKTISFTESFVELQKKLDKQFAQNKSYAALGRDYTVSRVIIWRIMNEDYEPKDKDIRRKLGLTEFVIAEQKRNARGQFTKRSHD